jgi:hypothetical protein
LLSEILLEHGITEFVSLVKRHFPSEREGKSSHCCAAAASALATSADTQDVLITVNLLFTTSFKTKDEISSLIRKYRGAMPGVVSHEVTVLTKMTRNSLGAGWGSSVQASAGDGTMA